MTDAQHPARVVGVDVGGTKTHLAYLDTAGVRHDVIAASSDWRRGPLFGDERNLARLAEWIAAAAPLASGSSIAVGLRDGDTDAQLAHARSALREALGMAVRVENDADLLGPAAGLAESITMVVGTGAIVSGRTRDGERVTADGHGWLFGDWGSGPALVREAITRMLEANDRGDGVQAGALPDPLGGLLLAHFDVPDVPTLASNATINAHPERWGAAAPRIFEAAERGSPIALATIEHAAGRLASGVALVRRLGALGDVVVAAGGVISAQRMLEAAIRDRLAVAAPGIRLTVLTVPPVEGALRLAEQGRAGRP